MYYSHLKESSQEKTVQYKASIKGNYGESLVNIEALLSMVLVNIGNVCVRTKKIILPNDQIFHPKHYTNCRTFGVVYLLLCYCGCYCVGKAKMKFWR